MDPNDVSTRHSEQNDLEFQRQLHNSSNQNLNMINAMKSRRNGSNENTPNALLNRNRNFGFGPKNNSNSQSTKNQDEEKKEENSSNNDNSSNSGDSDNIDVAGAAKAQLAAKTKAIILKQLLILSPYILGGIVIFIAIAFIVLTIQQYFPFFSYNSNSTYSDNTSVLSGNTYLTTPNDKLRPKEEAFYRKLDEVKTQFLEQLGVTIDVDYIIGALFYDSMIAQFLEDEDITTTDFTSSEEKYGYGLEKIYILAQYQIVTHYYVNGGEYIIDPEEKRAVAANDPSGNPWEWFTNMFTGWKYVEKNVQTHYGEYENTEPVYTTDVSKEGVFYWNLVDEDFINSYYSGQFTSGMSAEEIENKKITIVKGIYKFVEDYKKSKNKNFGYLTDGLKVNMYTCDYEENGRGYAVSTLTNQGTTYPAYTNFRDYIKGAIYGEIPSSLKPETKESVKAFIIAFSSYALNRSHYKSGDIEIDAHVGDCWQLSCSTEFGCQYCRSKIGPYGTNITGAESVCPTSKIFSKPILDETTNTFFDEVMDEMFGTVMISNKTNDFMWAGHLANSGLCGSKSNCMGQDDAVKDAKSGMTYQQILDKYYSDFTLTNIKEDLYVQNADYGSGGSVQLNEAYHYHQGDYRNVRFCGRSGATISSSGCGTTSAAIVASLLKNRRITPVETMELAYKNRACGSGIIGTDVAKFAPILAKAYGLSYSVAGKKETNKVIEALKSSNAAVIGHIPAGTGGTYSSKNGHYLTLVAINSNGKVLVWDPGYRSKSRDGAWQDINFMAKYLDKYYIFTR